MSSLDAIRCRDEILQVMYWMRGEQVAASVTAAQLHRFVAMAGSALEAALHHLVECGWVSFSDGRYALTETGSLEAARRFLDEFSPLLGRADHLSCRDPDCDCHTGDWNGNCHAAEARR